MLSTHLDRTLERIASSRGRWEDRNRGPKKVIQVTRQYFCDICDEEKPRKSSSDPCGQNPLQTIYFEGIEWRLDACPTCFNKIEDFIKSLEKPKKVI